MTLDRSVAALPGLLRPAAALARVLAVLNLWSARRAQRRTLRRLDLHLLRDIGLDEARARDEALKHFWLE